MNQSGEISGLRASLKHVDPQVRTDFIAQVAAAYAETQDLGRTAERFGAKRRTLERAIRGDQDLAAAIQKVRDGLGVIQ